MQKTNKVILVIVLIVVVLFGVGQFFAYSNTNVTGTQTQASSTAQTVPTTPATQVVAYVPPTPASSTPVMQGSCWTGSIAVPFRTDAWRCSVGNSISDPCFQIPGSANLLCNANPANPDATSSFILHLTQPLPQPGAVEGPIPTDWAWLIQLIDGTVCSPFTGTLPIGQGGVSANYGCAPATPGGEGLYIFNINTSSTQWTAEVGTFSASTSSLPSVENETSVPIATVWQ